MIKIGHVKGYARTGDAKLGGSGCMPQFHLSNRTFKCLNASRSTTADTIKWLDASMSTTSVFELVQ